MIDMSKTANLYARIEPDVKEQAESVLETLGISVSSAINMFYKQIILQQGIPFDVKLPKAPENAAKWSKERLDAELEKGYDDMLKGRVTPWNEIYAKLSEAISEIKNGSQGADAEKFIKGLMDS